MIGLLSVLYENHLNIKKAMKIEITEEGVIYCDGPMCDFFRMYDSCAECGGCPLVKFGDEFFDLKLSAAI